MEAKIDVEGHELLALAGLQNTVRCCRPKLLVEVDEKNHSALDKWALENEYRIEVRLKHNDENYEALMVPA